MTDPLDRLADTLTVAPPAVEPAYLVEGVVVSLGPPIRLDVGDMQLAATTLVSVGVGHTVQAVRAGGAVVILGRVASAATAVGAKVRNTVSQSVTNTLLTTVGMNAVVGTDPEGFFSAPALVVPAGLDGLYLLSTHGRWEGTNTATNPITAIFVNGDCVVRDAPTQTGLFLEQHCATPWLCIAGDAITMRVRHDSAANRSFLAQAPASGTDPVGPILEMWRIG